MDNEVSFDKRKLPAYAKLAEAFYNTVISKKSEIESYMTNITNNWTEGELSESVKKDINEITTNLELIKKNTFLISDMLSSVSDNFNKITY